MAYTNLVAQPITVDGLKPVMAAAAITDGNMFTNTGAEFLYVANGGIGAVIVTVATPAQVVTLDIEDVAVTIPAGEIKMIGPFEPRYFNQKGGADHGKCYVEYDQVTSVTIAIVR